MNEENEMSCVEENKTVITDNSHPDYYDDDNLQQLWYQSYRNHGGKKSFEQWKSYLEWFNEHVAREMVQKPLKRSTWNKWVKMIGSLEEADAYVDGVDEITPLT